MSQLTDRARNLAQELVRNDLKEWTLIKTFYEWCHTKFGDPDAAITAWRELKEIKQWNLPFIIFLGDFLNTVAITNINEEGKILVLKELINRELVNTMIIVNRLKKLDEFITLL